VLIPCSAFARHTYGWKVLAPVMLDIDGRLFGPMVGTTMTVGPATNGGKLNEVLDRECGNRRVYWPSARPIIPERSVIVVDKITAAGRTNLSLLLTLDGVRVRNDGRQRLASPPVGARNGAISIDPDRLDVEQAFDARLVRQISRKRRLSGFLSTSGEGGR